MLKPSKIFHKGVMPLAVWSVGGYTLRPNFRDNISVKLLIGMNKSKGPGVLLIGVGTIMTSMIAAGFVLGYLADSWLNTQPIFLISFGALGLIGGFLKAYRLLSDPELY